MELVYQTFVLFKIVTKVILEVPFIEVSLTLWKILF